MTRLTSDAVEELFQHCIAATCEPEDASIKVEGIVHRFAFDRERIKERGAAIGDLLAELPDEFHREQGGGWTFLNACIDRSGAQWTGLHLAMEQLFALGIAAGRARFMLDRDMWSVFPGGMPYVQVSRSPIFPDEPSSP